MRQAVLIALAATTLSACRMTVIDAGCQTYAAQRPSMPTLSDDAVGRWVDQTDAALTETCR